MTAEVRLIVRLPQTWCIGSREALVRVAAAAEELGFWGVSVQDHLLADSGVSPCGAAHDGDDRTVFEALGVLAFVAGRTERVRLVTGVLVLPFRNVLWLAKEVASLDALSGGRTVIGVGIGALRSRAADRDQDLRAHRDIAAREFDLLDVGGHRGRMMDEYIEALKLLWTHDAASYAGEYVAFEDLGLHPRPERRPPIWVGGRAEAAQRRAALLGDGWFPSQASPDGYATGRDAILAIAAEHGQPAPAGWGLNVFACADADGDRARATVRAGLGHRFKTEAALFESTIAGTPAEVRERMERYVAAGVRAFDLKLLPLTLEDTLAQMRLFAREVMPSLAATG